MRDTLYRLARNAYIAVLEVFDGRYQLKRSDEFAVLMSNIDSRPADVMAAHISCAAGASDHDMGEILAATICLSQYADEKVPDLLMEALTVQARTGCDLQAAAERVATDSYEREGWR